MRISDWSSDVCSSDLRVTFPPRLTAAEWEQGKVTLTPFSFPATDHAMMARALRLAERGAYTTRHNPLVGCVIARGDEVVGEGWHQRQGGPHAEVFALEQTGDRAKGDPAYVTLETCAHNGSNEIGRAHV